MSLDSLKQKLPTIESVKQTVISTKDQIQSTIMAPSIPKTHKAAMFKEKMGPLVVEEVETKRPVEGEVLIKVLATGVCHSDALVQSQAYGLPLYALR